jgi:ABC-2 type transport system ATP-binding protein
MNHLQITGLRKAYPNGTVALNGISLDISNGMFGLLGPNGAGKSSLMRTIATLQKPDSGSIIFNNADILSKPLHMRTHLGYLPQEFGVYPHISAVQLLDHIAVLKGITHRRERKQQIDALLEQTNLTAHRNKAVSTFSGGMRQRFGIAQALLGNPQLIIVDEPTAGLDPEERHRFNSLLSDIGRDVIVILSTHIVEDVRNLCTAMAVIAQGSVVASGSPSGLIKELDGQVWECAIGKQELKRYQDNLCVLSSRLYGGALKIHVRSGHQPGTGFYPITPDLEDVYFSTLSTHPLKPVTHA